MSKADKYKQSKATAIEQEFKDNHRHILPKEVVVLKGLRIVEPLITIPFIIL